MSLPVNPCTAPIVSTVTVLPVGDASCSNCAVEIVSVAYTDCGTLRVSVTPNSGTVELSLDGAPYVSFSQSHRDFPNVPIGSHQVALRKGNCTDLWSGSVYCQARRCFLPGAYECVETENGELTGHVNTTNIIEYDCVTQQPTGRTFLNNGVEHAVFPIERDTVRCADTRCFEYGVVVLSATIQTEIEYTDCDTGTVIIKPNIVTGANYTICSSTVPQIKKNGSANINVNGLCRTGVPDGENCCTYLVIANGQQLDLIFGNIRYTDCATGEIAYSEVQQGASAQVISSTEPVLISDKGGSVEVVGDCEPIQQPSADQPAFTHSVNQPYCIGTSRSGGTIVLSGISNATRYKVCNSASFNCPGDCTVSDGMITGPSRVIEIAPVNGAVPANVTVRVYNGEGCSTYRDVSVVFYNQNCATPEIIHINTDFMIAQRAVALCDQRQTYDTVYNMYARLVSPVIPQAGKDAYVGPAPTKTVPNGMPVTEAYLMASLREVCGSPQTPGQSISASFYRFALNLNRLYADFPTVTEVTFEVWGERTRSNGPTPDAITAVASRFSGVRTIAASLANGAVDFSRDPTFPGQNVTTQLTYNGNMVGFRRICTYTFNRTTQTLSITP